MKTREEIEDSAMGIEGSYDQNVRNERGDNRLEAILEVLLDIRDLLTPTDNK